jgi:hypothetical protein
MIFRWFLQIGLLLTIGLYSCENHSEPLQVVQIDLYYIYPGITLWGRPTERSIRKLDPAIITDRVVIDSILNYAEELTPTVPTHDFMGLYILCYLRYNKGSKQKLLYDGFTFRYQGDAFERDKEFIDYLGKKYRENTR